MKYMITLSLFFVSTLVRANISCSAATKSGEQSIRLTYLKAIKSHIGQIAEFKILVVSTDSNLITVEITDTKSGFVTASGPINVVDHQHFSRLRMQNEKTGRSVKVFCSLLN